MRSRLPARSNRRSGLSPGPREAAELRGLLDKSRMATLTGAGGCGKTRLALRVVASVEENYRDGIFWIDLAPLAEAALTPNAVADALGIKELPLQDLTDTIALQ